MLAFLCKAGIRLYWHFIPKEKRIVCLYKDHCSKHIYNSFEHGFMSGMRSLLHRYKNCNNTYTCTRENGTVVVRTSTGESIVGDEISDLVYAGCEALLSNSKTPQKR
jgi:putative component of membrane protein insertase Oxa1/YidC/SpoIIIJ protein YidD